MRMPTLVLVIVALAAPAFCEMRGGWVSGWNPGYLTSAQADATIKAAKQAKLNALFIQVRKVGDAYYDSSIEPRASGLAPDYDPLAYIIQKAHAQGIKVHAWMNVFRVWKDPVPPTDPCHLTVSHPDWLTKTFAGELRAGEGYYSDPGISAVREHNAAVAEEIARKYDVDGIHLDYIRYPGKDFGYSDTALARYYAETGATGRPEPTDAKWLEWRRQQVTEQVRLIRQKVKAVKPKVVLSAATIAWGDCPDDFRSATPYIKVCQDWREWLEAGLLDANVPMNYKAESKSELAAQYRRWLAGLKKWSGGRPVYVGINVHLNKPAEVARQIQAARKAGHQGFVLFDFNESPTRGAIVRAIPR